MPGKGLRHMVYFKELTVNGKFESSSNAMPLSSREYDSILLREENKRRALLKSQRGHVCGASLMTTNNRPTRTLLSHERRSRCSAAIFWEPNLIEAPRQIILERD